MRCTKCGMENADGVKICAGCGNVLESEAAGSPAALSGAAGTEAGGEPDAESGGAGAKLAGISGFFGGDDKNRKTIAVAVAAAAVIGVGAFAAANAGGKDAKEVVIQAFENIYTEDQFNPADELFGASKFAENAGKTSRQTGLRLVLDSCSEKEISQAASGAGIRAEARTDLENQAYSVDMGVIFQNMDLATMELYYGDDSLQAALPELCSQVFTLDLSDDLAERVKESPLLGPLAESQGIDVEAIQEYLEIAAGQVEQNGGSDRYDLKGLLQRYKDGCQAQENLKAAMTVRKTGKDKFRMDGAEVTCTGYQVNISKDSMIDFLRTSSDFFLQDEALKDNYLKQLQMSTILMRAVGSAVDVPSAGDMMNESYEQAQERVNEMIDLLESGLNDVEMKVYVDKKGRLAAVKGSTTVNPVDSEALKSGKSAGNDKAPVQIIFDVQLQGGNYLTQNATAEVELSKKDDSDPVTIRLKRDGTYDGSQNADRIVIDLQGDEDISGSFTYENIYASSTGSYQIKANYAAENSRDLLSLEISGVVNDLTKGEYIRVGIDSLKLAYNNSEANDYKYVVLRGEYYYGSLKEEAKAPSGEKFDVISASEDDWSRVLMQIYLNGFGLMNKLGPVFSK